MVNGLHSVSVADLRLAIPEFKAGERVLLSGEIYTARDAAHLCLFDLLDKQKKLPLNIDGAVIYYAGPTPGGARPVGSCGPTTSGRMDAFTPELYDMGLLATIGKGERSAAVKESIIRNRAIYFCAIGGAGALVARHIISADEVAFPELGTESVKRLVIKDMPLTVGIDSRGCDLFETGRATYARNIM